MHSFQYRPGYNRIQIAGMTVAAMVLAALWWDSGNIVNLILALLVAVFAIGGAVTANSDGIALAFDDQGVTIRAGFSLKTFAWHEVTSIYLQMRNASSILTIPFGGTLFLCFQTNRDSLFERRVWLSTNTMELPPGGPSALLDMLNRAWEAAKDVVSNKRG